MLKEVYENKVGLLIIFTTLSLLIFSVFLIVNIYLDVDELANPCERCVKNNPAMQDCMERFNKEMFIAPSLNLTGLESYSDSQQ